jgi:hypothetical protein
MNGGRLRVILLTVVGVAALIYAVWPPMVETPYLSLAGGLLGFDPAFKAAHG